MRIICAPDSFKESLTAAEVAEAMGRGVSAAWPDAQVDRCPIADGGEGTAVALVTATGGSIHCSRVLGPLAEPIDAEWGLLGPRPDTPPTAVIEMAAASGLALVPPDRRDPTRTTTYGVGQLIRAALDAGAQRIILGIGGSATNDGGCGAAQSLGVSFFDAFDQPITTPLTGGMLEQLGRIDLSTLDARLASVELEVACDVTNPLTGPNGAAAVYGPQKGATAEQVEQLDRGLAHLARLLQGCVGASVADRPGAGAAGGFGAGAVAMLGGTLRRGIELVLEATGFAHRLGAAELCLTGEGRLDGQTSSGKAVVGVARAAREAGVPCLAFVGAVDAGVDRTLGGLLEDAVVIGEGVPVERSMREAAALLERRVAEVLARRRAGSVARLMRGNE